MDEQDFWHIIAQSLEDSSDVDAQLVKLKKLLEALPDDDLIAFQELVDHMMTQAYSWGLFGAAHIMMGGCSDEGFEHFRAGLIMKGKEVYEGAVREPDSLAEVSEVGECPDLLFLACEVYEERNSDGAIYERHREAAGGALDGDSFDETDDEYLRHEYPRLWAIYCEDER